jgi:hypothetical protein
MGLVNNSPAAQEFVGFSLVAPEVKAYPLLPERVSELWWLSHLLIEDKIDQIN